jgi:hypothetical protein
MRILALAISLIGAVSVPAHGQTRLAAEDGLFPSLAQRNGSASGRTAQCMTNPFFALAHQEPPKPYVKRQCVRSHHAPLISKR